VASAIFDDHIAFKIAEELEDWKERQQELFKAKVTHISNILCLRFIDFWVI
jgi:hypothetical protein